MSVRIHTLEPRDDERGEVHLSLPDWCCPMRNIRNVHLTTMLPGTIRGNHFHKLSKELLVIKCEEQWQFCWSEADGVKRAENFERPGVTLIEVEAGIPHAVVNRGARELVVVSLRESAYDPNAPDAHPHEVVTPEARP